MGFNPYIGQLLLVGFNYSPLNWYFCQGQLLPISGNEALYNLLGTTFGGDGVSSFGVPDLRGRVPVHQGSDPATGNYAMGQTGGSESVTVLIQNYPSHNHSFLAASQNFNNNQPSGNAIGSGMAAFSATGTGGRMAPPTLTLAPGGNQAHENRQPFLALNWIISIAGIYPSQN
jgi:microcystin-dependent protein